VPQNCKESGLTKFCWSIFCLIPKNISFFQVEEFVKERIDSLLYKAMSLRTGEYNFIHKYVCVEL
jgi:hypothetical protein